MAKIAQLVEGKYNILDNIPVINQDLTASGFTHVANTYYRHTGVTTDTFTQGVIYLYDTTYHKLGESGGGTTLNKYEYNVDLMSPTYAIRGRIDNILKKAIKYSMYASCNINTSDGHSSNISGYLMFGEYSYTYSGILNSGSIISSVVLVNMGDSVYKYGFIYRDNTLYKISTWNSIQLKIIYYNDTEITA